MLSDAEWDIVARILDCERSGEWEITDRVKTDDSDLILVWTPSDSRLAKLRGSIIDLQTERVISTSIYYDNTLVTDKIEPYLDTDSLLIEGQQFDNPKIFRLQEGAAMRVLKYRGQVYFPTNRKIKSEKSRWGKSPRFLDIYHSAGGPTADELFPDSYATYPIYYTFIIVHPALLLGSLQTVSEPYLLFVGSKKMPGLETVSCSEWVPTTDSKVQISNPITIDEANQHLRKGYSPLDILHKDPRASTGEAVLVVSDRITKIYSSAYDWRLKLRNEDCSIEHRFFELLDDAFKKIETSNRYLQRDVIGLPKVKVEPVKIKVASSMTTSNSKNRRHNKREPPRDVDLEDTFRFIHANFLYSLSDYNKERATQLPTLYPTAMKEIWTTVSSKDVKLLLVDKETKDYPKYRLRRLLNNAEINGKLSEEKFKQLLNQEYPSSVYRIWKFLRNSYKE